VSFKRISEKYIYIVSCHVS